ncbi:hypothetical protein [Streptomyces sp. E5N298]|uniref:hypothetical protein n=1 Tax=Streptomyces sp. E5N298 TaxID=1851983 RepID=UPI000EF60086|nr:hypothetical protein [Streptomyces sp. E5N298]
MVDLRTTVCPRVLFTNASSVLIGVGMYTFLLIPAARTGTDDATVGKSRPRLYPNPSPSCPVRPRPDATIG